MILFDEGALTDLEPIFAFQLEVDEAWAVAELERIRSGVLVLEDHPHIGRPVSPNLRELVLSGGKTGYLVMYQYVELDKLVRVLAVRHQREDGYPGRPRR